MSLLLASPVFRGTWIGNGCAIRRGFRNFAPTHRAGCGVLPHPSPQPFSGAKPSGSRDPRGLVPPGVGAQYWAGFSGSLSACRHFRSARTFGLPALSGEWRHDERAAIAALVSRPPCRSKGRVEIGCFTHVEGTMVLIWAATIRRVARHAVRLSHALACQNSGVPRQTRRRPSTCGFRWRTRVARASLRIWIFVPTPGDREERPPRAHLVAPSQKNSVRVDEGAFGRSRPRRQESIRHCPGAYPRGVSPFP